MAKLRVLQFGRFFPPAKGGIETVIQTITNGLVRQGFTCDVLCSNTRNEFIEENLNGSRIIRTKSFGLLFSVSLTPQFISKLREIWRSYDIIHLHHPDPMAALALFLCRPKSKIVVHWHSDVVKQKIGLLLFSPLQKWILRRADLIIATSRKYADESFHLKPYLQKTTIIPIGIDGLARGEREDYPKKDGKFKIFAVGRFVYYKGFENLISSAEFLDENFIISIGGAGPLRQSYEKLIAQKNLKKKVKLIGKLSDEELIEQYKSCDVFCLPSIAKSEAFGIVMVEAMSLGKPVVSTRIPGSGTDWVNLNGITGLTVKPDSPEELAESFLKLKEDENLRFKYGRNARDRFKQEFTSDVMVQRILKSYYKVL
ncbi:MAG: glycosyltransferase [Cyclobacteriaceae bacterium]